MPELTLACKDKEYICTSISVEKYRKYTELMEKNESENAAAAFRFNAAIMKMVFGTSERQVMTADVVEQLISAKMIHFVMQDIITKKFLELDPDRAAQSIPQEKSAFDEYDEENGYNDAASNIEDSIWKVCRDNVDRVVKLCIRVLNDSMSNVMKSDIMSLLDHVAFEIMTINEK